MKERAAGLLRDRRPPLPSPPRPVSRLPKNLEASRIFRRGCHRILRDRVIYPAGGGQVGKPARSTVNTRRRSGPSCPVMAETPGGVSGVHRVFLRAENSSPPLFQRGMTKGNVKSLVLSRVKGGSRCALPHRSPGLRCQGGTRRISRQPPNTTLLLQDHPLSAS
jgi:hypothetical protein